MFKVSINCWDSLTGEYMGGQDFFDTFEESKSYYDVMVKDYKEDVEIYLVNCTTNEIIEKYITTKEDLKMTIMGEMRNIMKRRYTLDYTINTSINVSMVDFKNAGLTDEEILKVVRSKEYVNCASMTRSFSNCEITFYSSCFNRNIIEQTVKEIQESLNSLI